MKTRKAPFRRLYVVFVDHSAIGIWRTQREAEATVKLRKSGSILETEYVICGPYVLQSEGAS